jgi:hypothetical protein
VILVERKLFKETFKFTIQLENQSKIAILQSHHGFETQEGLYVQVKGGKYDNT